MNDQSPARSRSPSPDFVRAVLKGHSGLGLAFAAAIYLVCLSGVLAVFVNEFMRWENPAAPRMEAVSAEAVNMAYLAALEKAGGGVEHIYLSLPNANLPWLLVTTDKAGEQESWLADATGRLVGKASKGWSEFLVALHVRLHLPHSWGQFIVGLTGVALLSSLISGVLAHPRIFRDAFHLRFARSRRLQEADLHNRIGVWALPFHVIVSLTGALLGLSFVIVGVLGFALFQGDTAKVYDLFLPPHPVEDERPAPPLDLLPMMAQLKTMAPGAVEFIVIEHPTERGGAVLFNIRSAPERISGVDSYTFDHGGKLYHSTPAAKMNLGEMILGSLGPLHFGWFGGGAVKIAYGVLGLGLTYLAAGGVLIWLARRRDKGRPAPGWERVWAAVIWGQPAAMALTALVAVAVPSAWAGSLLALWGALSLLAIGAARFLAPVELSRWGRLTTGAALIAVSALHVVLRPDGDPMATMVNGALLLGGLLLVTTVLRSGLFRRLAG